MNNDALLQAREVLTELQEQARILALPPSVDEIARAWGRMLELSDRIYQKLGHAVRTPAERRWYSDEVTVRRTDPFLSYVHQARNAQHHGVERVTEKAAGMLVQRIGPGQEISGPGIIVKLVPVTNRGRQYPVPDRFADIRRFNSPSVQDLGMMLEMAMRALVQGAEHVHRTGRLEP